MLTDHEREAIEATSRAIASRRLSVDDGNLGCFPFVVFFGLWLIVASLWRMEDKLDGMARRQAIHAQANP